MYLLLLISTSLCYRGVYCSANNIEMNIINFDIRVTCRVESSLTKRELRAEQLTMSILFSKINHFLMFSQTKCSLPCKQISNLFVIIAIIIDTCKLLCFEGSVAIIYIYNYINNTLYI